MSQALMRDSDWPHMPTRLRVPPLRLARALAKDLTWRLFYRRWPQHGAELEPGYTLVLPVPGDLPAFFRLALANAAAQDPEGRVETLVVPDTMTAAICEAFDEAKAHPGAERIRLVQIPPPGRTLARLSGSSPVNNYFLQVHAGIAAARTTHVLLHDADLFITDPGLLRRHYRRCADEARACVGVSPAWDNWLRECGFAHVVATWELMLDVRWARSFAPWEHRAHYEWLANEWHGFDVTLAAQARTPPERCALHDADGDFVHFNYVIGQYRHFQRGGATGFEDAHFCLLLIRLLSDAVGGNSQLDVPEHHELAQGLTDASARVTYLSDRGRKYYPEFREKISRVIGGPLIGDAAAELIERRLEPFDGALG